MDRVSNAPHTTTPDKTGFGLYVAHRLASDLGWSIEVSESEDGGARFDLTGVDAPDNYELGDRVGRNNETS